MGGWLSTMATQSSRGALQSAHGFAEEASAQSKASHADTEEDKGGGFGGIEATA